MRWFKAAAWLAVPVIFVWVVFTLIGTARCAIYGSSTERETRYSGFVGCMVKTNHGWVPRSELRSSAE